MTKELQDLGLSEAQVKKIEKLVGPTTPAFADNLADVMFGIRSIINICGDNPARDGLLETPFRVAKAFLEYTEGYREDPKQHLRKAFDVEHDDLIIIKDIEFNSMCEHHFAPFFGVAHIAYIPKKGAITGLSKFARLVDGYAKRFQVQERLTQQIADAIEEVLEPQAVAVVIEAKHYCMCGRGVKKPNASTTTSTMRGLFKHGESARMEILNLISKK
jgi:GTP cyclohydrolase I